MRNLKLHRLFIAATLSLLLASCHKDKVVNPTAITEGMFVLNQGVFGQDNSTLTYFSEASRQVNPDIFYSVNNRGLGDTGNDIEVYGNKMYIVVNVSSTIEVVDSHSAKSIKQISMVNGTTPREPRDIVFYQGNAYISSYDGTVAVLDTASLTITKYITVGSDPEQLVVANGKIYVANSGGLNYPNYDNTVSVINLSTNTVTKTLTVVENPIYVSTDNNGHVYVLSEGDYGATVGSSLAVIDDNADVVSSQTNFDAAYFMIQGTTGYFITNEGKIGTYNTSTQSISSSNFVSDGTAITSPFALGVDGTTGEVFVCDAKNYTTNGTVYAFDKNGKNEYSFTAGINPGKIAFLRN
jgi:YVTN family beta-propeller protein